jgi:hypothetical protein
MWIDPLLDRAELRAAERFAAEQHDDGFAETYGASEREALAKLAAEELAELEQTVKRAPILVIVTAALAAQIEAGLQLVLGKRELDFGLGEAGAQ